MIQYIRNRLNEASTYAGIVTAIAFGSTLEHPWDYVAIAIGVLGVVVPTTRAPVDDGAGN